MQHIVAKLIMSYCDSDVPSVVMSGDSTLYIIYTSTSQDNNFDGNWEKVISNIRIETL